MGSSPVDLDNFRESALLLHHLTPRYKGKESLQVCLYLSFGSLYDYAELTKKTRATESARQCDMLPR